MSPEYNIQLQHPDLPLVRISGLRQSYLPAELCNILPGQPVRGKLADEQVAVMSTVACRPPNVHGQVTIDRLRHLFGLGVIRPELISFGITIGPDMAVVPGRILPRPAIAYASNGAPSINDRAHWNLVGVQFAVGARLDNWAVLVIQDGSQLEFAGALDADLREVVYTFRQTCNASGMRVTVEPTYAIAQLPPRASDGPMRQGAIRTIQDTLLNVKPKPALILVMLSNEDKAIYEGVKHLCDIRMDVATVCVQSAKIRRRDLHYLANVACKVNMKLGGVNHKLGGRGGEWLKSALTMVVGMDVSHPGPSSAVGTRKDGVLFLYVFSDVHLII